MPGESEKRVRKKSSFFSGKKVSENLFYYGILLIPIVQFLLFYVVVNFNSILLAFQSYDYGTKRFEWAGWHNFFLIQQDITSTGIVRYCLKNSGLVYLSGLLVTTPLSILFSYWISTHKGFFAEFFKVMLFLPTIIPGIVLVVMYKYLVDGAIPSAWQTWTSQRIMGLLFDSRTAMWMIVIFLVLTGFGTNMVLYTGAMGQIPRSQIEAAEIDGAGEGTIIFHIILPAIYPTFTTMMILSVAGFFVNQASLYSFYGGSADQNLYTFGYYLFIKVVGGDGSISSYPYAAAYGLVFTLIAAPITLLVKYLMERFGPSPDEPEERKHVTLGKI